MTDKRNELDYWLDSISTRSGFVIPLLRFRPRKANFTRGSWTEYELQDLLGAAIASDDISDVYLTTGLNVTVNINLSQSDGKKINGSILCVKEDALLVPLNKKTLDSLWDNLGVKIGDITNQKKTVSTRANLSVANEDYAKSFRVEALNYTSPLEPNGYAVCLRPLRDARDFGLLDVHPLLFDYLSNVKEGMHLTLGKTGTGKSTTLSSLLDLIVRIHPKVLLTLEKPIEYLMGQTYDKLGYVNQFDVNENLLSFADGASSFLRFHPDLILFGELKDSDEIETSLELSTTGHAVFATAHTNRVWNAYARLVKKLPKDTKDSSLLDLVSVVFSINAQMLLPGIKRSKVVINEFVSFNEVERENLSIVLSECLNKNLGMAIFVKKFKEIFKEKEKKGEAVMFETHVQQRYDDGLIDQECYYNTMKYLEIDVV